MSSDFAAKVMQIIRQVPEGQVVSYGQVALYAGAPGAARAVGWWLRTSREAENVPWWRVINNAGRISIINMFHQPEEQRRLLQEEGIEVSKDFRVDIEAYRWHKQT